MSHSIVVESLTKSYPIKHSSKKEFLAVQSLSFTINQGEVVAFLGPNGAGKSTTIKMLCGILTPTSGSAKILGFPAGSRPANKELGLVFGTRSQLYMHMTVRQSLDLISEIYFVTGQEKRKRIDGLSQVFAIEHHLESRVRSLSLGERMRCEIVAALIHKPKVLLADEPTIGLDIVAKNLLRDLIRRWQEEEKTTLVLTSHDLSDVEALCKRCILIDHGQKQFDGLLSGLKGNLSDLRRMTITVADKDMSVLQQPRIRFLEGQGSFTHRYEIRSQEIPMAETIGLLSRHYGEALQDLQIAEVTLEEVLSQKFHRPQSERSP